MADTTFIDNSTVIVASWLNDINNTVYTGLGGEQTPSGIRTHLGLGTASQLDVGTSANKVVQLDGTAKLPAVDGSQLTGIVASVNANVAMVDINQSWTGSQRGTASFSDCCYWRIVNCNCIDISSSSGTLYLFHKIFIQNGKK